MPRIQLVKLEDNGINVEDFESEVREEAGDKCTESLIVVARRVVQIPEYSCTINIKRGESFRDYASKWTQKFISGWENRPSKRTSNPIGTKHDPVLDDIIITRLPEAEREIEIIKYGHRLSMSAENIAGSLLEEFLATNLLNFHWHCCWGDTMKSIDFCNVDGQLLQVKNSDNSENSSSKTVRDGTQIKHWFRRFSRTGRNNWDALNELIGIHKPEDKLTEEKFREFVKEAVNKNPAAIYIEEGSPWNSG